MKDVKKLFVFQKDTIEEVIAAIQHGGIGIAVVVDKGQHFISTITDGDIRRAILKKIPLNNKVNTLVSNYSRPIVAAAGTSHEEILKIMREKVIRHVPLLDKEGRVVEVLWLSELVEEEIRTPISAVVMAGGRGQRLKSLTDDIPKPMLPLQDQPLMERIIGQLRESGIKKVDIATHYKSDIIIKHFGNGNNFGVDIDYINEDQPLGTAGALGLMEVPSSTTLVINGDILTQMDFKAMYEFHHTNNAIMTVGARKCELEVPYGVIEVDDVELRKITEKPVQHYLVNAGVYLLEPIAYNYIPKNKHCDMTELVSCLKRENHKIICFPIKEYWLDIGHPADYKQAEADVVIGKC